MASPTHSDSAGRERLVTLPGARVVGLAEYGAQDGSPVLALHGAPACRLMFAVADEAARRHGLRLIAPDRPGYGLTPIATDAQRLQTVAADMAALADQLGLARFGVLGISGGAPYAAALAARAGARVAALMLISPLGELANPGAAMSAGQRWFFLRLPRHRRLVRAGARVAAAAFKAAPRTAAGAFAAMLGGADRAVLARPAARDALIAFTQGALAQGIDGAVADHAAYASPWNVDLTAIRARSLVWQGTADRIVPVGRALDLARAIPGCRLELVDGGGHFWVLDAVETVMARLADMLREGG